MATTLIDSVLHWKKKLDKDPDDDYILNVIRKLSRVPITLEILETTHIGKTVRKLSKRDDIVGEKAKTVLNKWREAFANQGSDKNQKLPNVSKKENVNKESKSSNNHISHEKTIHKQEQTSHNHEHKHKNNSASFSLSEQPSKKCVNGSYTINNSTDSSHSSYKYEVKERNLNYMDYDPHAEGSEGYNPECPELFPTDKSVKTKKKVVIETYEPSSVKRKLVIEKMENEEKSLQKKFKPDCYSSSNSGVNPGESKKLPEKKDRNGLNKETAKNESATALLKKEHNKMEFNIINTKNHKIATNLKKSKCNDSFENDGTKSKKSKLNIHSSEEFTSSEVSFEDCLGFNDIVSLKKSSKSHTSGKKQLSSNGQSKDKHMEAFSKQSKNDSSKIIPLDQKVKVSRDSSSVTSKGKVSNDSSLNIKKSKVSRDSFLCSNKHKVSKDSSHNNKEISFSVPKPATKLDVADINLSLPEIQPNYRPLPRSPDFYAPKKKEVLTNEEAILFTSSRREKTNVYSGRKSGSYYTDVPSLYGCCARVLMENIDAIECVGDATYDMMKPVLDKCSPSQLYNIENYNPKFLNDTNELWQQHCFREYKLFEPMEHETWRELFWRAHDEREKKLKTVTANISASMSKSTPVRQVKLAYVDSHSFVKPPRDVARRQAKHGTAAAVNHIIKPGSSPKSVVRPSAAPGNPAASSSHTISSSAPKKPKIAPLMAKTLKSMRAYRRK